MMVARLGVSRPRALFHRCDHLSRLDESPAGTGEVAAAGSSVAEEHAETATAVAAEMATEAAALRCELGFRLLDILEIQYKEHVVAFRWMCGITAAGSLRRQGGK
jgi:hypothetical protein